MFYCFKKTVQRKTKRAGVSKFYDFFCIFAKKLTVKVLIFSKIKSLKEAEFYVKSALEFGWTRNILLNFIKADSYKHQK